MYKNRFGTRLAAITLMVAVVAGVAVFSGVAANAAPPAGDGPLTLAPATGTDQTSATLTTPKPCPDAADSYNVLVAGPNNFNGTITNTQSAGLSHTDPVPNPVRPDHVGGKPDSRRADRGRRV